MKNLINSIMKLVILMVATKLFPEYVFCDGWRSAIIVVLIMTVIEFVYVLLLIGVCATLAATEKLPLIITSGIILVVGIFSAIIVELVLISTYYDGFAIYGGWLPYVVLALAFSVFSVRTSQNKEKKN